MRFYLATISLIVFVSVTHAEDFEHCNYLLERGITNITRHLSADHSIAYKYHSNCGQDFDSASDGSIKSANASVFGYGSGGVSSNTSHMRTRLKEWCKKNKEFAETRNDLYEEARILSEPALESWNQCQKIADKGINISISIQGEYDEFINFTIDSKSDGTYYFYGISEINYNCRINGLESRSIDTNRIEKGIEEFIVMATTPQEIPQEIKNGNIHINCRRIEPEVQEVSGIGKITYTQGHINVMTSGPAMPITMPKVVESYYVTPPKTVMAFDAGMCPAGWSEYQPAYGRFIRGIDKSGEKIDPDGVRKPGSIQEQSLLTHNHSYKDIYWSEAWGAVGKGLTGNKGDQDYDNKGYEMERDTAKTGGNETRPKNVALLYCIKDSLE